MKIQSRSFLSCVLVSLCLVLTALIVANSTLSARKFESVYRATFIDMIGERLASIVGEINNFPRTAGNDILFLSQLSVTKRYDATSLEHDFLAFLTENTAYHYLGFVDKQGRVLVSTHPNLPNPLKLQWLDKANALDPREVYISPIELKDNIPIIVYATPVYDQYLAKQGIMIALVYADYFLDDIRQAQREGETVFLTDSRGNYLAHPDHAREFGHLLGHGKNFQSDYPDVAEQILINPQRRMVETDNHIFSMWAIYPTKGSFALYKGNEDQDYSWVIVSVASKKSIEQQSFGLQKQNVIFLSVFIVILIATYSLVWYLTKKGNKE